MSDPITREETYLAAMSGESVNLPEPITREEMYLAAAAGIAVELPEPITRKEQFLMRVVENGGNADQSGGGLSTTAVNLLMDVLNAVQYHTNVSGKIEQLREALLSGAGSGGTGGGDTPDEPDEPVVTDDITVSNGVMTIVAVGSAITVSDGAMAIA